MDYVSLRLNLGTLVRWHSAYRLALNVKKFRFMCYPLKSSPASFCHSLDGSSLSNQNYTEDIGVTFDSKLRFDTHPLEVTNQATKFSGFILRTSSYLGLHQPSSTLFNFLLLTIVEYCTVIWTPSHNCDCLVLKKVQRKCTYCLFFKKNFLLPDTPRLTSSS